MINIKETFLRLTANTYPYPLDKNVIKDVDVFPELEEDGYGNYFYRVGEVGESTTVFSAHLDTADLGGSKKVKHVLVSNSDGLTVSTDGTTILGADDKAGVTIMLYMISENVPGLYYFFIGEESGLIGSKRLLDAINAGPDERKESLGETDNHNIYDGMKRMVSFDRRGYKSIITRQRGRHSCSDEFADYLISEFDKYGMEMEKDPGGIYTDSAVFPSIIPECTNISVGYFREHSNVESQNITFLETLCETVVKMDWESAPYFVSKTDSEKIIDFLKEKKIDYKKGTPVSHYGSSFEVDVEDKDKFNFSAELRHFFKNSGVYGYIDERGGKLNVNYYDD
jgi:hypothetical protein